MSGSREGQWAQCQCVDTALCRPVQSVHDSPFSRGVAVVQQGVSPFCCPSVLCHLLSVYYLFTLRLFLSSLSLSVLSLYLCVSLSTLSLSAICLFRICLCLPFPPDISLSTFLYSLRAVYSDLFNFP